MFEKVVEIVKASKEKAAIKEEIIEKLNKEIEIVSKKKTPTKKEAVRKAQNEKFSEIILDILEADKGWMNIDEIKSHKDFVEEAKKEQIDNFSTQRVSSILRELINEEFIEKKMIKKKTCYKLIETKPIEGEEVPDTEEEKEIKEIVEKAQAENPDTEMVEENVENEVSDIEENTEEVVEEQIEEVVEEDMENENPDIEEQPMETIEENVDNAE